MIGPYPSSLRVVGPLDDGWYSQSFRTEACLHSLTSEVIGTNLCNIYVLTDVSFNFTFIINNLYILLYIFLFHTVNYAYSRTFTSGSVGTVYLNHKDNLMVI